MVWVFNVKNVRADYRFCCFNINELSCYVIFTTPVSTDQWRGEIGCFINCIASDLFFCSYNARIPFKNLLPVLSFLLTVLFCILLRKCSLIWIIFFSKTSSRNILSCSIVAFYVFTLIYYLLWCSSLILLIGDIKTNSGPISSSGQCFSICNWNLNSITAHNCAKLSLLTTYNLVHSFDIICLSEAYLNSEIPQ